MEKFTNLTSFKQTSGLSLERKQVELNKKKYPKLQFEYILFLVHFSIFLTITHTAKCLRLAQCEYLDVSGSSLVRLIVNTLIGLLFIGIGDCRV